jgi:hypothetical protein
MDKRIAALSAKHLDMYGPSFERKNQVADLGRAALIEMREAFGDDIISLVEDANLCGYDVHLLIYGSHANSIEISGHGLEGAHRLLLDPPMRFGISVSRPNLGLALRAYPDSSKNEGDKCAGQSDYGSGDTNSRFHELFGR